MGDITHILLNWSSESKDRRGRVIAALYAELRRSAAAHLRGERDGDLQPTALVNEAYLRLVNIDRMNLDGRQHFLGLAGRVMREILVDEARRQTAKKRDRGLKTRFTGEHASDDVPVVDILQIDGLLNRLAEIEPVYVDLFEARAFAGMTIDETSALLNLSPSTVKRKWKAAVAWLNEQTGDAGDRSPS